MPRPFVPGRPMKLTVHTVRYGVTEPQVRDFVKQYCQDERGRKRLDEFVFWAKGMSRTVCEDLGMQIETIIKLEPMSNSEAAGVR